MEAMETMPEEDLVFIATTNPALMKILCTFLTIELHLHEENKPYNIEVNEN